MRNIDKILIKMSLNNTCRRFHNRAGYYLLVNHMLKQLLSLRIFQLSKYLLVPQGFSGGISDKEPTCQCKSCKRYAFNPWVTKIPWRRNPWDSGNPLQNPVDRGAWQAIVHSVTQSWTLLEQLSTQVSSLFGFS